MHIEVDTLLAYGATSKKWIKGEKIFAQGNEAKYYHQIAEGAVKMATSANLSKEFIQGLFLNGNSFGEPALMIGKPYPASAYAETDSLIYRLSKEKFLLLLEDHPAYYKKLFYIFAERLYCKTLTANILMNNSPEEKIIGLLEKLKIEDKLNKEGLVPYTRQQIADFTGLRVETVIRTLAKLVEKKQVVIINHKVFYL